MEKKISLMAGAALLFAGLAQAETPAAPDYIDPGYVNGGHFAGLTVGQSESDAKANQDEAAAPASAQTNNAVAFNAKKNNAAHELHPDARPVYNDGGHWGN